MGRARLFRGWRHVRLGARQACPWLCCGGSERTATLIFSYDAPAGLSSGSGKQRGARGGANGRKGAPMVSVSDAMAARHALLCVNIVERSAQTSSNTIWRRRLKLDGNPSLSPLPDSLLSIDPVGADLLEIPSIIERLTHDFDGEVHSPNRLSAWTFTHKLRQRLRAHRSGAHDGSVDLLITGCEVSLWLGEQFASDLARVYPKLKIVSLSANKFLGKFGQQLPIPQLGFPRFRGIARLPQLGGPRADALRAARTRRCSAAPSSRASLRASSSSRPSSTRRLPAPCAQARRRRRLVQLLPPSPPPPPRRQTPASVTAELSSSSTRHSSSRLTLGFGLQRHARSLLLRCITCSHTCSSSSWATSYILNTASSRGEGMEPEGRAARLACQSAARRLSLRR